MLLHEFFGEGDYYHRTALVYETRNSGFIVIFMGEGRSYCEVMNTEQQAENAAEDYVMGES